MTHSFDVDIAIKYGINAAIILNHLYFWVEKNRANEKHFYNGRCWTYSSVKALHELFPYMGKKQISVALEKLEQEGLIISGNYNKSSYDRTKWYAITEAGDSLLSGGKSISQNGNSISQNEESISQNGKSNVPKWETNTRLITDTETDTETDINLTVSNDTVRQTQDVRRVTEAWNALRDCGIKPISRMSSTSRRYRLTVARIKQCGLDEVLNAINRIRGSDFLQGKVGKGWVITYDWFILPNNFPKVHDGNYDNPVNGGSGGDDEAMWKNFLERER